MLFKIISGDIVIGVPHIVPIVPEFISLAKPRSAILILKSLFKLTLFKSTSVHLLFESTTFGYSLKFSNILSNLLNIS